MLTKGAIGNLINRYKAVLGKCRLINTFGSLAVAAMFVAAAPLAASAVELTSNDAQPTIAGGDYEVTAGDVTLTGTGATVFKYGNISIADGRTLTLNGNDTGGAYSGTLGFRDATDPGIITGAGGNLVINAFGEKGAVGIAQGIYTIDVNDLTINASDFGIYNDGPGDKTITANKLTINAGGDGIHVQGKNEADVNITANTVDITGGIGIRNVATDGASDLNITAADTINITATGTGDNVAAVDSIGTSGTSLNARVINITAEGANSDAINVGDGSLTLNATESINVDGDIVSREYSAGFPADTTAGTLSLTGGDLRVTNGTVDGYEGTFEQTGGRTILNKDTGFFAGDVNLKRGQILMGDVDLSEVPLTGEEAVLALGSNVTLNDTQSVNVGTTSAAQPGGAAFAADGMLVADGSVTTPLLSGPGTLTMEDGSTIYIVDAQVGQKYQLTDFADQSSLSNATLMSSRLTDAVLNPDGTISVTLDQRSSMLAGAIPQAALTTMVASRLNDVDSPSMGIRFLSRAAEPDFMASDSAAVSMVNEVSRAAAVAGVQNTALRLSDAASENVLHHMSLGHYGSSTSMHTHGVDVWATPMYGNTYTSGMGGNKGHSVRGNYGGLALGVDTEVADVLHGKMRAGIAVNGGGGKADTKGTATDTENSYGFGGVNLYGGWAWEKFNLIGALGYGFTNSDVKMGLPASMQMPRAKADVDTHAFTADLRLEYAIPTEYVDILPHVGVRYTHLHTDSYSLKVNGAVLNSVSSDDQDIVQFPVGVSLAADCEWRDWSVKPMADVSYIPAVGDHKTKSNVRYSGLNAVDRASMRIMDDDSWSGMLGLMAERENFAMGLHYTVQASSHETDQGVNMTLGWKF